MIKYRNFVPMFSLLSVVSVFEVVVVLTCLLFLLLFLISKLCYVFNLIVFFLSFLVQTIFTLNVHFHLFINIFERVYVSVELTKLIVK